jgi:thiol:disulfide interchange protein DsbD
MALQAGGENIGWGFQMQEPLVLIALSFLFTYIALVLFDALAVGSRFAGIGESLVSGEGWSSNFFTGVLAVVVASPCTAPFMAAAVGIAMVSEPLITLLIFNGLAIGFALPMTLLFISDKARKLLPKPGMWMETFKRFLAFPMLATVAWLAWVYAGQVGSQGQFVLLIALISFSLFLWLQGKAQQLITRLLLMFGAILSIALPIWANNFSTPNNASASTNSAISVPFSATALAALKADNKVVVVNMTADWCITCKVNEQVAFSTEDVRNRLAAEDVTYMVGDWTNKNQEILNYLNSYDRAGVPLYVVYAGNKHVQVLPQILTSNTVLTAINQATKELSND